MQGLRLFDLSVRGKSVLLKPNLVDLVPGRPVTTHPALLGAAAEAFLQLGAKEVVVAEDPATSEIQSSFCTKAEQKKYS
jgi:uncharacterized protein (DUF362 family)